MHVIRLVLDCGRELGLGSHKNEEEEFLDQLSF
jgi:hypothetical protein